MDTVQKNYELECFLLELLHLPIRDVGNPGGGKPPTMIQTEAHKKRLSEALSTVEEMILKDKLKASLKNPDIDE